MLPRKQILQAEMIFFIYQKLKNFLFLSEKLFSYTFTLFYSVLLFYFLRPAAVKTLKNINMLQQEHTKKVN